MQAILLGETRDLMTAGEAGRAATTAGAKRLTLAHFWPASDCARSAAAAATQFDGPIFAADEGIRLAW